jgi:hypothetical protein
MSCQDVEIQEFTIWFYLDPGHGLACTGTDISGLQTGQSSVGQAQQLLVPCGYREAQGVGTFRGWVTSWGRGGHLLNDLCPKGIPQNGLTTSSHLPQVPFSNGNIQSQKS